MSNTTIKEYSHISEYGYIKDDNVYLKGYLDFSDREIGVVRESDEQSIEYFVNRYDMATQKVEELKQAVADAENKGSYLMKLLHMRTYLASFNGLGDFIVLYNELENMEDDIREYIAVNRVKNQEIKHALLAEAKARRSSTNWEEDTELFKDLKMKWIKTGSAHKDEEDVLSVEFNEACDYFFEQRKEFMKAQQLIIKERVNAYRDVMAKMEYLNGKGCIPEDIDKVKVLQRDWKEVGNIPAKKFKKLTNSFRMLVDFYFNTMKRNQAMMAFKRKTPVEQKMSFLRMVEDILQNGAPFRITKIKTLQNDWKDIGKLPNPEDKELNLKFRIVCNEIFETHFLEMTAQNMRQDYMRLNRADQLKFKIDILSDSIRIDEEELDQFNMKYGYILNDPSFNPSNNYKLYQERNNFVNKLKTKQRILKKIQDTLYFV